MNESTNVSVLDVILVFDCYTCDKIIEEEALLCEYLNGRNTAGEIVICINNYIISHKIV